MDEEIETTQYESAVQDVIDYLTDDDTLDAQELSYREIPTLS